ncbi:transglutaminase family protein [Azoarcus sp. L1K30]|uniref:transglutaminase family protein n=1 Tax=Azoarcus sp. L1K30 TaxID=2820277 RepID=UPI001B838EAC|nr:transglutaminase family protein [Azoarcus sp. L1K30]MBR0565483.1 transglutaminase family protein [Azoarcus sp. L1K30]
MTPPTTDAATDPLVDELIDLDGRIAALGAEIWIGAEPTFTDRRSEAAEWLYQALGGEKEVRAARLLRDFSVQFPGGALLRTIGRQYPGEPGARWSFGVLARRDGTPLWRGPPDPLLASGPCAANELERLQQCLLDSCGRRAWSAVAYQGAGDRRVLLRPTGEPIVIDGLPGAELDRPSLHAVPIPADGLRDVLAESGHLLLLLDTLAYEEGGWPVLELPAVADVAGHAALLEMVAEAGWAAGLNGLVLRGHPPPVDGELHWTSLTPDPAVIEANLAPATDLASFHRVNAGLFAAARGLGLYPFRLHYNGGEADSGGGGQLTLGGPSAQRSPFFVEPHLLTRLIRYLNRHPALSYWWAPDSIGSGSQAPRADEGPQERRVELALALAQLERIPSPEPGLIWSSLAPFLADSAGNSHRSEINIEKLWNPYLGARGMAGLVEFRALRMAPDAATLAAEAALLRALVARLMMHSYDEPMIDWGTLLHNRFALPWYLEQDLRTVLDDLDRHGLGLGPSTAARLLDDARRELGQLDWAGLNVRVLGALEFWPLIGDVTAQQPADSRLVDASTQRIELRVTAADTDCLDGLSLRVDGHAVPLRTELGGERPTCLAGIRYRSFVPLHGLHPALPAQDRVELVLTHPRTDHALRLTLFDWHPQGEPYDGLPASRAEARRRRAERLVSEVIEQCTLPPPTQAPDSAYSDYCFDLRWVGRA